MTETSPSGVTHRRSPVTVTQDLSGTDIIVWVHELEGQSPGPVLGVIGTQHGDEWHTVEAVRRAVDVIKGSEFAGSVLLIPVANPVAFVTGHRLTQPEADEPDMNRVWPGHFTWLTDMLTKALVPVMQRCDALIDLHFGQWGVLMANSWWSDDLDDPDVMEAGKQMSIAFGTSVQRRHGLKHPGSGTLAAYAGRELGIPCISGGIGGAGFSDQLESTWLDANVTGIQNIMTFLKMRDTPMTLPDTLLHFGRTQRIHPSMGGILVPEPEVVQYLPRVEGAQLLGRMVNAQTFETVETLVAPTGGWLYWTARSYPLRPGGFAFGLADETEAEWLAVER